MKKKRKFEPKSRKKARIQKRRTILLLTAITALSACVLIGLFFLVKPLHTYDTDDVDKQQTAASDTEILDTQIPASDSSSEQASESGDINAEQTGKTYATASEDDSIELIMVGDVLLHQRVLDSGLQEDGTYDFSHLFKNVGTTVLSADLAIVNQETVLGGEALGIAEYPSFNSPQEIGDAEAGTGFDVILSATNHALDRGKEGILATTEFWEENYPDIAQIGMYNSESDSENIYVFEKSGMKIAILNYTYGTNGISLPSSMPYAVNYLNESEVRKDIETAQYLADFVVVCPHWGTEYRLTEDSSQEYWCNIFLEEGVDLVIGAHPHVIEPIEMYTDDDGHQMLVYYSLGNFVCGTSSSGSGIANRMVGGMADVTIGRDENGDVAILDYDVYPLVTHEAEGEDYTVYFLEDYTEELASENRIVKQDSEFSKEYCENLVKEVWGK